MKVISRGSDVFDIFVAKDNWDNKHPHLHRYVLNFATPSVTLIGCLLYDYVTHVPVPDFRMVFRTLVARTTEMYVLISFSPVSNGLMQNCIVKYNNNALSTFNDCNAPS